MKLLKSFLIILMMFCASLSYATSSAHAVNKPLKVIYYIPAETPVLNNVFQDIWSLSASNLGLTYSATATTDLNQALLALSSGRADVLVGPFEYSANNNANYVNSYVDIDLGVITPSAPNSDFWAKTWMVLQLLFSKAVWILLVILLLASLLIWFVERNDKRSAFSGGFKEGFLRALWFQGTTFTTVAYGDTVPINDRSRVVTLILQFVYLFLLAAFTANITAEMTSLQVKDAQLSSLSQLHDKKVAYLAEQKFALTTINKYFAIPVPCNNIEELINLVKEKKVSAAIAGRFILRNYLYQRPTTPVLLTRFAIDQGNFVFMINQNPQLVTALSMQLYQLHLNGAIDGIITRYVGADPSAVLKEAVWR